MAMLPVQIITRTARFRILQKHREEAVARAQAEYAYAIMRQTHPGPVLFEWRGILREMFADQGLIGYAITGEIEVFEQVVTLADGMCLAL